MEASKGTKRREPTGQLAGLEDVPLDQLAIDILEETPEILPDLMRALSIIRRSSARLGILEPSKVEGWVDIEEPEVKAVWIRVRLGDDASVDEIMKMRRHLDSLILPEFESKLSNGRVMVSVRP